MNKLFFIVNLYYYLILLIFLINYIFNANHFHSSQLHDFFEYCLSLNVSNNYHKHLKNISFGKDLWTSISKNKNDLCLFFKRMNIFKINNTFYYHRLYDNNYRQKDILVTGVFPHTSYYRLIPKNKANYNNVVSHTYEIQKFLYAFQHPINCENKKFLIIKGYPHGHGSEIHVLTSYLALALSTNRIAILDPYYISKKAIGEFCNTFKNWLCFIEQLTNCSLPKSTYKNITKYISSNQTEKYLYIGLVRTCQKIIPQQIINIIEKAPFYRHKLLHYWRIQAVTYIFRLNDKCHRETNRMIIKSFGNSLRNGCFNIWVRHGDKYKEMALLESKSYIPSYEVYKSILAKNEPIYLSTDDPNVTKYFDNKKDITTYYLKFLRLNDNFKGNMKRGDKMTLYFIADIKAALYCNGFSGTRNSNVIRLIDELRSTVGLSANVIYFENGLIKFNDTSYEYPEYW